MTRKANPKLFVLSGENLPMGFLSMIHVSCNFRSAAHVILAVVVNFGSSVANNG